MTHRTYATLKKLRSGQPVTINGQLYRRRLEPTDSEWLQEAELQPGDLYIAERNTGPKLLRAVEVDRENNWVTCDGFNYAYDISECVPVEFVDTTRADRFLEQLIGGQDVLAELEAEAKSLQVSLADLGLSDDDLKVFKEEAA